MDVAMEPASGDGGGDEGMNAVDELNRLEHRLRQEDAVMEPDIWPVVVQYLTVGGQPATVVELLTDSYQGYAQMASLACKWLSMVDEAAPDVRTPMDIAEGPVNEFTLLKRLAEEQFDPEKLAEIMGKGTGPPEWVDGLASSLQGRQLIYRLAQKHSGSLLLNFAIQKILLQGHVEEVARVGASLATFFGNYHRLLAARLRTAPSAGAPALAALSAELQDSCCASQHTYLHAQQLLTHLGRHPGGAVFRRLSQDLEARAAAANQAGVFQLQSLLVPENAPPEDIQAARLVAQMQQGGVPLQPPDVAHLHHLYHRHSPPPRLTPLRQPRMLECLIATAFTPQRGPASAAVPGDVVEQCVQLLGLAAAARETLSDTGELEGIDELEVPAVCATLREAQRLVAVAGQAPSRTPAAASTPDFMAAAEQILTTPVAAMGVLHHVRALLGDGGLYREPSCRTVVPALLGLLARLLVAHPLLASLVLEAAWGGAREVSTSNIEVAKQIMELLAHLVAYSQLSVEAVDRMRGALERHELDPAFARYFIAQVLALCAPPYSPAFATGMARLLVAAGVRRSLGQRDPSMGAHLREFANACTRGPALQLGQAERALLDELR